MRRPQFTLRTLLTVMLAVACFLGGMALQRRLDRPKPVQPTVDIVVGVHGRELEEFMGDLGEKLKVSAQPKQEE